MITFYIVMAFWVLLCMLLSALVFASVLASGLKEVVAFYLQKKMEAIEELEKKFSQRPGNNQTVGRPSGWEV